MTVRRAQALVAIDDPLFISIARQIAELRAAKQSTDDWVQALAEAGALLDYGVDLADLYSRSAAFVDKIFKGTPPGDLPVEQAINSSSSSTSRPPRRSASTFRRRPARRADEVIE